MWSSSSWSWCACVQHDIKELERQRHLVLLDRRVALLPLVQEAYAKRDAIISGDYEPVAADTIIDGEAKLIDVPVDEPRMGVLA